MQVHLAIFFQNEINRPDKLIGIIAANLGNLFDEMPTILPIPENILGDIPIVHLKSKDEIYQCQISKKRLDFFFKPIKEIVDFSSISSELNDISINLFNAVSTIDTDNITRIGFIITYLVRDKGDSTRKVVDVYFKKQLGKMDEILIRYNIKGSLQGIMLNNLTLIRAGGVINEEKSAAKGIIVEKDINTHINNRKPIKLGIFKAFLDEAYKKIEKSEIEKVLS